MKTKFYEVVLKETYFFTGQDYVELETVALFEATERELKLIGTEDPEEIVINGVTYDRDKVISEIENKIYHQHTNPNIDTKHIEKRFLSKKRRSDLDFSFKEYSKKYEKKILDRMLTVCEEQSEFYYCPTYFYQEDI